MIQKFMDEVNALNIPQLYTARDSVDLSSHLGAIDIVLEKMKLIQKRVKQDRKSIAARWDGRNKDEALAEKIELAPYPPFEDEVDAILVSLKELRLALKSNNPLPSPPRISKVYFAENDGVHYSWEFFTQKQAVEFALSRGKEAKRQLEKANKAKPKFYKVFFGIMGFPLGLATLVLGLATSDYVVACGLTILFLGLSVFEFFSVLAEIKKIRETRELAKDSLLVWKNRYNQYK